MDSMKMNAVSGEWTTRAPLSTPRSHPAVASYGGKIYAFGGGGEAFKSLGISEVYDPKTNSWSQISPMPTIRSGAAAAVLGEAIFVMGGGFRKPDGRFKFLTTVEIYLPEENRWECGPDLLQPHDYPASSVLDGQVYIIGGHHPDATEGGPQTDPAFSFSERWDGKSETWEAISPLPTPRFAASALSIRGQLWVTGGVAARPEGFHEYDLIECFDPKTGQWSENTLCLPWPSAGQGTCLLENRLYTFGGFREGVGIGRHGAVCNLSQKRWGLLPSMPLDRAAMGVAVLNETIYLIGGWRADRSVKASVLAYQED